MTEHVVVIGAGIGGLSAALALGPTGRQVTVLERDDSAPEGDTHVAFRDWKRSGVGHLRQSHAFLARLRNIIKDDHPELLKDLLDTGVRELGFEGMLSEMQLAGYQAKPGDAELTIITSRRTTLELVMRRYVERMANVTLRSNALVRELITEKDASGTIRVKGVTGTDATGPFILHADVVVDATGKNGGSLDQLKALGAPIEEESENAGILYFTRHYRLREGRKEPERRGNPPAGGDLGYLKFGVFPGDNGCFSITMCTPEIEYEMRKAIVNPDKFHEMTQLLPGLKLWTNEDQAEPTSKVFGMGDLHSRWRDLVTKEGKPAVLGFLAMGDTLIRTNPLYGRGCSFAAVSAYMIRDVLAETQDPAARVLAYHKRLHEGLRPYYLNMRGQDRDAIKRAQQALAPVRRKTFRQRLGQSFGEDGIAIAMRYDTDLLRQAMRGFHMLEHPNAWLKRPRNLMRVLRYWLRGKKKNAAAYPPKAGPKREVMMRSLGLDHEADIKLAAQQQPLKLAA